MTAIITVHGTGAGDPSSEGGQWWQLGSAFQKRLAAWLDLDANSARIEPFHWGTGPNSETERRKAGQGLLKVMMRHEKAGEPYFLIGHSHGGSVIHHALMEASMKRAMLPNLRQWITIGTPFIWTRPHRLTFNRLTHLGKVSYVMMLSSLVGLVTSGPVQYFYGKSMYVAYSKSFGGTAPGPDQVDVQLASQLMIIPFTVVALFFLIRFLQRKLRRRYSLETRGFFQKEFAPRWQSLRSIDDEAINALKAAKPMGLSIFDRRILVQPAKSAVVFIFVVMTTLSLSASLYIFFRHGMTDEAAKAMSQITTVLTRGLFPTPENLPRDPVNFKVAFEQLTHNPILAGTMLASVTFALPILFGVLWLVFAIIHMGAYVMGIPVAAFLNRLTGNQLRDEAFGNDTGSEQVHRIEARPEDADVDCQCVPAEVETALSSFAAGHAGLALARARHVLGINTGLEGEASIAQLLAKQLTGNELVHTAYFEVDSFAKLIAVALSTAGCGKLSGSFQSHADCSNLLAWHAQMKPRLLTASVSSQRQKLSGSRA